MTEAVIVMAKYPRKGAVKTRLVPPLSADEALSLYRAMLRDTLELALRVGHHPPGRWVELRVDRPGFRPKRWCSMGLRIASQGSGDLGTRMARALDAAHRAGAGRAVLLGADSPVLPDSLLECAFDVLRRGAPACAAPALDGGYVLLGATLPAPPLFDDIPWGTAEVLPATRRAAQVAGIALCELPAGFDVDDHEGLARLRCELERTPSVAPATARWLARHPGLP